MLRIKDTRRFSQRQIIFVILRLKAEVSQSKNTNRDISLALNMTIKRDILVSYKASI
ncbi:hypothetical protein [Helicobacter sp. T3_23-1059]